REPDKEHLVLSGVLLKDSVEVVMKRVDLNRFRLVNRGFHWVNETPFNR
ncbi:MAG: hypothetical protein JST39_06900, partial [Bacteroidetes bacterium]|nr:hypothetical protein [Bacteroidota bacterium]